jgi:lysophospholipase L1-like esterase
MISAMKRLPPLLLSLLVCGLLLPAVAPAKPAEVHVVRHVGLVEAAGGRAFLLFPVRYPIQMQGRIGEVRVSLVDRDGSTVRSWVLRERVGSGRRPSPDRRRNFTFVHRVGLQPGLAQRAAALRVRVLARARVDLDRDGRAELRSTSRSTRFPSASPGERARSLCSSIPHLRVRPGRRISVPLPVCGYDVEWRLLDRPERGFARIRHGRLVYVAPARFRGSAQIHLGGARVLPGAGASRAVPLAGAYAQVTVGTANDVVVRALGDSVTAGFGYYSDGGSMGIGELYECRPAAKEFDDACSSNSLARDSKGTTVEYAPDYGLANNVSWAAQWANEHGITDFKNFAVSGSEPASWAPGGELHETAELLASEDPDYILMTMGANPLLSELLFGADNMGCAVEADIVGGYRECVEAAFAKVRLRANLESLYAYLVQSTGATIYLMRYHLSVPSSALAYSATQIAMMGALLNREIATVAGEVSPARLRVVTPPHFDVGIDISPVFPSSFSCSRFGYEVDGPSVQSTPTQDELEVLHPLSFCEGPERGPPWVISGDTGIHPSAAGYAQMAARVPPPS